MTDNLDPMFLPVRLNPTRKIHFIEEGCWDETMCGAGNDEMMLVQVNFTDDVCKTCERARRAREHVPQPKRTEMNDAKN